MTLTLSNIISILLGCLSGISVFITILFKRKYAKILKPTKELVKDIDIEKQKEYKKIIQKHYMNYIKSIKQKDTTILKATYSMAKEIAETSKDKKENALYDITIDDILSLTDRYANKIEETIYLIGIDGIEDLKINTIINMSTLGKKVYDIYTAKIVKILIKAFNYIFMLKNILYIPYWIKKGTSKTINKSFTNLLIYSYFEFIGTELIYIYNK